MFLEAHVWPKSCHIFIFINQGLVTRDFKPALQLTEDIMNMHFEHYAHLLICTWLTFEEEMIK